MFSYDLGDGAELRMLEVRHAAEFLTLVEENRGFFGEWLGWANRIYTVEDAEKFIERGVDRYAEDGLPWIGIWQDGRMAGGMLFFQLEPMIQATKIGYWLAEWANGRGLMTRAIRPVLRFVFEDLKLNRVGLEAEPGNLKSKGVAERLGFTFEGVRRDGWQTKGEYVDIAVYSMLAADWKGGKTSQSKAYDVSEIRKEYPKAYKEWLPEEDETLILMFTEGKSIAELANSFGRKSGAIRSRINKLGLSKGKD